MATHERRAALLPPALATRVDVVPTSARWQHEPKFDGYRIQCHLQSGVATLLSRNGLDYTHKFPRIAEAAIALLHHRRAVLDGEVVVPADEGRSPFQSLQVALRGGAVESAIFWVFDLLQEGPTDLRGQSLDTRRSRLSALLGTGTRDGVICMTPSLDGEPEALLGEACARGEEGIISKRRDAAYHAGRTRDWLKIKCGQRDDFVIVGYTEPVGARSHWGALLLATRDKADAPLRYAGRVGSGFTDALLADLHRRMQPLECCSPVVEVPSAMARGVHWVTPQLVADIAFAEWTNDDLLRQATFQGLRDDKEMRDVRKEVSSANGTASTAKAPAPAKPRSTVARRAVATTPARVEAERVAGVTISSGDRLVFPEIALTKRDLAAYYESVASLMLPHIAERPLSTVRCPDGPHQSCFYQKHWTASRGIQVRTVAIDEADGEGGDYAVVRSAHDIVALVQWNVIELHTWQSRSDALKSPDRMILDLDPGPGVGWKTLREGAAHVRALLDTTGLESWVKLSGGKGVHVTVPLERRLTWQQLTGLARLIAGRLVHDHPTLFVDVAAKDRRTRRIFVDWMRNSRGATAAAPWSVRARKNAPVAVPIAWDDLNRIEGPAVMTVPVVREFLASNPADPWRAMLGTRQRLSAKVLDALTPDGR